MESAEHDPNSPGSTQSNSPPASPQSSPPTTPPAAATSPEPPPGAPETSPKPPPGAPATSPDPPPGAPAILKVPEVRTKCVGRNNKGVTWGLTSVIGWKKEMEDAVAVIPGFMARTCDHVGGCAAPGSRTSSEISPVHFFGVYDGHGGSQFAD